MLFTVGGGEPQSTARIDVFPDGQVIWVVGPINEPDYTSLDQIAHWPVAPAVSPRRRAAGGPTAA